MVKTLKDYVDSSRHNPVGIRFRDERTVNVYTLRDINEDSGEMTIEWRDESGTIRLVPLNDHLNDRRYTRGMAVQQGFLDLINWVFDYI